MNKYFDSSCALAYSDNSTFDGKINAVKLPHKRAQDCSDC